MVGLPGFVSHRRHFTASFFRSRMRISIDRSRLDELTECFVSFSKECDDQRFSSEGCGALRSEATTGLRYVELGLEACINQKNLESLWPSWFRMSLAFYCGNDFVCRHGNAIETGTRRVQWKERWLLPSFGVEQSS